jgi:hypothetical protein
MKGATRAGGRAPPYACHLFTAGMRKRAVRMRLFSPRLPANWLHGHRFFKPRRAYDGADSQGNVGHLCFVFLLFRRGCEGNVCLLPFVVFRWKLRLNLFGGTDRNQLASESSVWAHIYACHHLIEIGCDFERDY